MNKVFLFLSFFFSTLSFAQENISQFPLKESSLLWKIDGNGIPKGSYLFGTMHLIEKQYFIFPDKLEKLVKKSDQLVMELPGLPNQLEAMKLVKLEEGVTFFDFFTPEQTDTILNWAKTELKMSEEKFRKTMGGMKPFVVVQTASQLQFIGKTESYEMTFEKLARENSIEIKGLETLEEQMSLFDDLTKEQQAEMVMEGIRDSERTIKLTRTMQEVYTRQNVDSLYLLIAEEGGTISEEQSEFLDDRNEKWIPKIEAMISDKKTFIAVGAGHLGGPNGVIRLLEKRGYTLSPVEL
jgi:uncharacterized protein YbaP (TraB family)